MCAVKTLICKRCGNETVRRSPFQKYCPACAEIAAKERKLTWQRSHPESRPPAAQVREQARQNRTVIHDTGLRISQEVRTPIAWDDDVYLEWCLRVSVPFTQAFSKNHLFVRRIDGGVALSRRSRDARQLITDTIATAIHQSGITIIQAKLWLDIFVQKPDNKSDAVNVVDLVCDAVKDATHLDDRWYSIRRLDWEVVKVDPVVFIGIGQDTREPVQICSDCGRMLTYEHFRKNSRTPNGIGRECRECLKVTK